MTTETINKTNGSDHSNCADTAKKAILNRLRILEWLPKYNKTCFFSDMIAGITVGLTMMPQSIAYASIAELPPHVGLYTAIMGSFIYIIFGTIKQVSIGPSSILSILTYSYLHGKGMDFIVLLSFLCGCVELLMGLLNLGFLVDFISAPVTSGFTSATSVVIILAQLKNIFGIKFKSVGVFDLIIEFFKHVKNAKVSDSVLGISSLVILLAIRKLSSKKFESEKLNKGLWYLAICRNALIVLIGSVIAFIFEYRTGQQPFVIAGKITPGLPDFKLPAFSTTLGNSTVEFGEMVSTIGSGIIVIPIVAVLANVAIAKTFADGRVFDASQEMLTLGIANVMGSFVGAMPTTGAFTRSAVNNASNVQTPMGGLYAGTMILLALSFLTPYFYFIPKSTIAAVLISAVMFMVEYWELPRLWRCNKFDFFIGLTTFISSLIFGVERGLVLGVALNMISILKLWARPKVLVEFLRNGKGIDYVHVIPELGLFFPGVNHLTQEMLSVLAKYETVPVVVDFRNFLRIDYTSCQAINEIIKTFNRKSRQLFFINMQPKILNRIKTIVDVSGVEICDDIQDVFQSDGKKEADSETPLLNKNIIAYHNETNNEKRPSIYDNNV